MKLPLTKPIQAHGDTISELTLRDPTGDDIMKLGAPFYFQRNDQKENMTKMDMAATYGYISVLAGIPLSSAKAMHPGDVIAAYGIIAGFFTTGTATPSAPAVS